MHITIDDLEWRSKIGSGRFAEVPGYWIVEVMNYPRFGIEPLYLLQPISPLTGLPTGTDHVTTTAAEAIEWLNADLDVTE